MSEPIYQNTQIVATEGVILPEIGQMKLKEHIPDDFSVRDLLESIHTNLGVWKELQTYYACAMMEVETKFNVLNQEFSLQYDRNPIETIKTRMKSLESIAEKLVRKGLPLRIQSIEDNIFDMAGVRVICSFLDDIYLLIDSFRNQDDIVVLQEKNYIDHPKPSGYRGVHLVVEIPIFLHNEKRMMKVEVQFRTIAMDFWASLEHKLRYKKNLDPAMLETMSSRLSECSEKVFRLDQEMQEIRNGIEEASLAL